METAIQEYSQTAAALAVLSERYKGATYDVTNPGGMAAARSSRNEIRGYRLALEEKRVEIKAPALERCRQIDSEATRIKLALLELEEPITKQITAEEDRKEAEKQAAIRAEQERLEAEQRALKAAEEARLKAEREEIARRQAELDRQEREARERRENEEKALREARRAEDERIAKEREKIERARRQQEERERAERMAREQAERTARLAEEAGRRAAQKELNDGADARGMLALFVERYGKLKEFSEVVKAIKAYQGKTK